MNRYSGSIGYHSEPIETSPGVWSEPIVEIAIKGTVMWSSSRYQVGENSQGDIKPNHKVRFMIPDIDNFDPTRLSWISWNGRNWTISAFEMDHPAVIVTLGVLYV